MELRNVAPLFVGKRTVVLAITSRGLNPSPNLFGKRLTEIGLEPIALAGFQKSDRRRKLLDIQGRFQIEEFVFRKIARLAGIPDICFALAFTNDSGLVRDTLPVVFVLLHDIRRSVNRRTVRIGPSPRSGIDDLFRPALFFVPDEGIEIGVIVTVVFASCENQTFMSPLHPNLTILNFRPVLIEIRTVFRFVAHPHDSHFISPVSNDEMNIH